MIHVILARASNIARPKDPIRTKIKIIGASFISVSFVKKIYRVTAGRADVRTVSDSSTIIDNKIIKTAIKNTGCIFIFYII